MNDDELNIDEGNKSATFKIDIRTLLLTVKKKILFIIIFPFFTLIIAGLIANFTLTTKWKVSTSIIAHDKNISKIDLPYMYQQLDFKTVVPTIVMRQNLKEINKRLNLGLSPNELIKLISISKNKTKIIKIFSTHENVETAVKIANTTAEVFIDYYSNLMNSSGYKILEYYKEKKTTIKNEISKYKKKSSDFFKKNEIISIENELAMKFEQLNSFELELYQNKMSVNGIQTRIFDMSNKISELEPEIQLKYDTNTNYTKDISVLEEELATLKEKYTDKNPKVLKVKDKIAKLKASDKKDAKPVPDRITYGKNPFREILIIDKSKAESVLKAVNNRIGELGILIDKIRLSLNNISKIENEYYEIKRMLDLNNQLLSDIENKINKTRMALDSNVNDFEIIERAYKPQYAESSGKKIFAILGGFLGFIMALFLVVAKELLDFTIKSEFDIKEMLNIKFLGKFPNKKEANKSLFYSALQIFMGDLLQIANSTAKPIIALAGDQGGIGKSFIIENAITMLKSKKKKILYIDTSKKILPEQKEFLINDLIYEMVDRNISVEKHEGYDKLYFKIDDKAFTTIVEGEHLMYLKKKIEEYDYVFWELFDLEYNPQLFLTIVSSLDLLLFVGRFRISKREIYKNIISFLEEKNIVHLAGVLNYVDKYYYKA
ncbi:MAG: hypothetical protein GQ534_04325 [Candidatus Delongbacteria bacterium]|nr:hypothetical protein [Candidatus Delongbacteria bacterium]